MIGEQYISYHIYEVKGLDKKERELVRAAVMARQSAQAPYSHYWVGAAVESVSGRVFLGCNVERATYTQTSHAEQVAVDSMIVAEQCGVKIKRIAIACGPENLRIIWPPAAATNEQRKMWKPSVPCGHCLAIIWENCHDDKNVEILDFNLTTLSVTKITMGNAFPFRFGPKDLGIDYSKPTMK